MKEYIYKLLRVQYKEYEYNKNERIEENKEVIKIISKIINHEDYFKTLKTEKDKYCFLTIVCELDFTILNDFYPATPRYIKKQEYVKYINKNKLYFDFAFLSSFDSTIEDYISKKQRDNFFLKYKTSLNNYGIAKLIQINYPMLNILEICKFVQNTKYKRTKEEIDNLRRIKGLDEKRNPDYKIKMESIREIENKFGSIDACVEFVNENILTMKELQEKYLPNITTRNLEKRITSHAKYIKRQSTLETNFVHHITQILEKHNLEFSIHDRILIKPKELDVIIPSLQLAFEFNGDYWHSDSVCMFNYGKTSYEVHKDKYNMAKEKGYELLFVWEPDWANKKEFVKKEIEKNILDTSYNSPILSKFSITPRKEYNDRNLSPLRSYRKLLRKNKITFNVRDGDIRIKEKWIISSKENLKIKGKDILFTYDYNTPKELIEILKIKMVNK